MGARVGRYRETMGVGVVAAVRCLDNLRYLEGQGEWGNTPNSLLEALAEPASSAPLTLRVVPQRRAAGWPLWQE